MAHPGHDAAELLLMDDPLATDLGDHTPSQSWVNPRNAGHIQLSLWARWRDGVEGLWWRVWAGAKNDSLPRSDDAVEVEPTTMQPLLPDVVAPFPDV